MTQRTMVLKMLSSLLVFLPLITGQPMPPEECCMEKKVGDFEYMFVKEGLPGMVPASCINMCIYKRVDTGKMYCFAPGDLHVDCEDDAADGQTDSPADTTEEEQDTTDEEPENTEEEPDTTDEEPDTTEDGDDGDGSEGEATFADCTCGVAKDNRVVGGEETEINKYPWMVGILNQAKSQHCGASLIASRFVLTAAHCFDRETLMSPRRYNWCLGNTTSMKLEKL